MDFLLKNGNSLDVRVTEYEKDDKYAIILPMFHMAPRRFYDELNSFFLKPEVIIGEGISLNGQKLHPAQISNMMMKNNFEFLDHDIAEAHLEEKIQEVYLRNYVHLQKAMALLLGYTFQNEYKFSGNIVVVDEVLKNLKKAEEKNYYCALALGV